MPAKAKKILFDSLGAQIQVQQETGDRLTVWFDSLKKEGYELDFTDYRKKIDKKVLDGHDVLVTLTRQWTQAPTGKPNVIPKDFNFSYNDDELEAITHWLAGGKGQLLFTNHTNQYSLTKGIGPNWPIFDISLAAACGATTVYAAFQTAGAQMAPAAGAPPEIVKGVKVVEAVDSGGINPVPRGRKLIDLPKCEDAGPFHYDAARHAFGALYEVGKGHLILLGHSGIVGNPGTDWPSPGQIDAGDNKVFLNNCIRFLARG
jgi:hypothetical protein